MSTAELDRRIEAGLDALLDVERAAGDVADTTWLDSSRVALLAFRDHVERQARDEILEELERVLDEHDRLADELELERYGDPDELER